MNRTKWMRLLVRDLSDVVRWAGQQNARNIESFRHRTVNGRESVSFRFIPNYAIEVGAREIIVICHVRASLWRMLATWSAAARRTVSASIVAALASHRNAAPKVDAPAIAADLAPFAVISGNGSRRLP